MYETKFKTLVAIAVVAVAMLAGSSAQACWRHHCGWGGGWGGGCYVGCYSGCWDGCYGGGYGWGGYYGGGGSGGVYAVRYGQPNWGYYAPSNYYPVGAYAGTLGYFGQNTSPSKSPASGGRLSVEVPADAIVYVNGQRTTSTGTRREYLSTGLTQGTKYAYVVRAEVVRDGKKVSETRNVQLVGGGSANLAMALPAQPQSEPQQLATKPAPATRLVVKLPAEAELYLGGNKTKATGSVREFATTALPGGEEWTRYTVRATIERDGKLVEQQQVVALKAGESRELTLDFAPEPAKVASAE